MVAMPHSLEIEAQVLGCMINKDDCALESQDMEKSIFYDFEHQKLFKTIQAMSLSGKPIDITLLLEEARKENSGISGGELAYITDICQKSALSHKFEGYVDKLKELSKKRQALKTAVELIPLIEKNDKDFDQHIDAAIKNLSGLECIESKVKTLGEIIHETYFL